MSVPLYQLFSKCVIYFPCAKAICSSWNPYCVAYFTTKDKMPDHEQKKSTVALPTPPQLVLVCHCVRFCFFFCFFNAFLYLFLCALCPLGLSSLPP